MVMPRRRVAGPDGGGAWVAMSGTISPLWSG